MIVRDRVLSKIAKEVLASLSYDLCSLMTKWSVITYLSLLLSH